MRFLQILLEFHKVMSVLYNIYCHGFSFVFLTLFVSWHTIIICSNHRLNLSYCSFLVKCCVLHTTFICMKSMIKAERGLFRPLNWMWGREGKKKKQISREFCVKGYMLNALMDVSA